MIIHVLAAAGKLAENTKSVAPAEKQKPARNPTKHVITVKTPYNAAYTTYNAGAKNMKPNSKGSVTPQTNAQTAAEAIRPIATYFLAGLAAWIIAKAAPGIPNIIHGKKPDI